jgi:putative hydrolase
MDLLSSDILRGDHHVHSTFSDDAVSTMGENIAAARDRGLTTLRLVDHVRASTTWVPEYLTAVRAERTLGVTVLTGVETKLLDTSGRLDLPADLPSLDAILIADHQFPGTDGAWTPTETIAKNLAPADATGMLITAYVNAMARIDNGQLAHPFSILPKIGLSEDNLSDEHLHEWATSAASTGTLIEINEKWGCPGPRAIRAALTAGATLVASTDSHRAADVGRYERVTELLGGRSGDD